MEKLSNKKLSTTEYFNIRAKRYARSIHELPNARSLDLVPYCYLLDQTLNKDIHDIKVLDAFAGTGFLANSFNTIPQFFQVDASIGMLGNNNQYKKCTNNDFKDILSEIGLNHFDYIFSHGGFHHVVDIDAQGNVLKEQSFKRQHEILIRLMAMLKPNGYLVIADIPDKEYKEENNSMSLTKIRIDDFLKFINTEKMKVIKDFLNISSGEKKSLFEVKNEINNLIKETKVLEAIPRHFFDSYISHKTTLGHTANYLDFEMIEGWLSNISTKVLQINFFSPWLFDSDRYANWFFKEKFSIGEECSINDCDSILNSSILDDLNSYLGVGRHNKYTFVNWGVTYAIYKKNNC